MTEKKELEFICFKIHTTSDRTKYWYEVFKKTLQTLEIVECVEDN